MNEEKWWQKAVVYQIYPRSFCDSNGDGIGDIPGIISKLDYVRDLGVDVIWLSPVYASPNEDNGYDISDYCAIHPDFGTMADFDILMAEAKKRGIKIIMDLVINHTSSEHIWFQKSRRREAPYENFYYWQDKPNNWTGFFGGGTWQFDEVRKQYYLHLFAPHQPDLNYHNPLVWDSIKDILTFWLDKGVAGFRCDVINIIWKDNLDDGKRKLVLTGSEHYLTLDGTHEILKRINGILSPYDAFTVGETVFVSTKDAMALTAPERKELSMVFGFEHMETDQYLVKWFRKPFRFKRLVQVLDKWQREVEWNVLYFENHDQLRSVSRFGSGKYWEKSATLLCTLLLTLRGTPYIYQGQELGMTNFDYTSMDDLQDVESHNVNHLLASLHVPAAIRWRMIKGGSRDHARTPMQWNTSPNAGFTTGKSWLKVNGNYREINAEKNPVLDYYRKMLLVRREIQGDYELLKSSEDFTVFRRGEYTIYLNHSDKSVKAAVKGSIIIGNYSDRTKGILRPWEAVVTK